MTLFLKTYFAEREMLNDSIPAHELSLRWDRCKKLLHQFIPQAQGLLVFSRLNIYYFSGSFANGVFWLPFSGEPVLFCRRGEERAKIESPLTHIYPFRSYGDIETILNDLGFSFPKLVAAEMNGLSWALSNSLTKYLPAAPVRCRRQDHRHEPCEEVRVGTRYPSGSRHQTCTMSDKAAAAIASRWDK